MNIGLPDESRSAVINLLQPLLAAHAVLGMQTRAAHWRLVDPLFKPLHEWLGSQYEALEEQTDELAERIRTLGRQPISTVKEFSTVSPLAESLPSENSAAVWLKLLLAHRETLIGHLRSSVDSAGSAGDSGTKDFLTGIMEDHEKTAWMLRSSI